MRLAFVVLAIAHTAFASDWTVHRDPFDPAVVAKYEQLLANDPYDAMAYDRLVGLYRTYRTTAALEAAYERGLDHASLVVRARLHRDRGDLAGARELFERATADDPGDARGWFELGNLARKLGDRDAARSAYDRAVGLSPPARIVEPALRALVELARDASDVDAVGAYSDQRASLAPRDPALWLDRGDAELALGHPDRAAASYAEAASRSPRDPERRRDALTRRGVALDRAHDDAGAVAAWRQALELAPRGGGVAHELVAHVVDNYRRRDAFAELVPILERDWPERTRGFFEWRTLASIYVSLDDPRALATLDRAFHAAPWETATARELAAKYDAADRSDAGFAVLGEAVRAAPGDAALAIELAERTWPRDEAAAVAIVQRVARAVDRDPGRLGEIADAFARHGRVDLAERTRERIARLEPDDESHWFTLVDTYFADDDPGGAWEAWRRVAKPRGKALIRFGERMVGAGVGKLAVRAFDDAIALDARDPAAWRGRAIALGMTGEYRAALEDAYRALELAPPDPQAQHVARHLIVQLLNDEAGRDGDEVWRRQLLGWAKALGEAPADLRAGYLLLEAYDDMLCNALVERTSDRQAPCKTAGAVDFPRIIDRMVRLVPDDYRVHEVAARSHADRNEPKRAIAKYREVARRFPARAKVVAAAIEGVMRANPDLDPEPAPTYLVDGPPLPALRIGATLGASISLRGDPHTTGIFGVRAVYAVRAPFAVTSRLEWTGGDTSALGSSLGVAARIATTPAFALSMGAGEHLEVRFGNARRFGVAGELEADVAFRGAPIALGIRLERGFIAGDDTRGVLALSAELR